MGSRALAMAAAGSPQLLLLFKDLTGSCEQLFQLLSEQDKDIALLILRGRFTQLYTEKEVKGRCKKLATPKSKAICSTIKGKDYEIEPKETNERLLTEDLNEAKKPEERTTYGSQTLEEATVVERKLKLYESVENLVVVDIDIDIPMSEDLEPKPSKGFSNVETHDSKGAVPKRTKISARFQCDKCEYWTTANSSLRNHMQTIHPESRFRCQLCTFTSENTGDMEEYMEAKYLGAASVCDVCDFNYSYQESLREHMYRYNAGKNVCGFECEKCNFGTENKETLKNHVLNEHGWLEGWFFN